MTIAAGRIIDHYHSIGDGFGSLASGPIARAPRESPAPIFYVSAAERTSGRAPRE